ncbi:hypothetical protein J4573_18405 [Actinomadura barringtoniae]|uniref:Uncharacterized protein n=1 Tax=Actinomadura barringtoniae TaxID=1427535 RepID=A0A939PAA8_9ACTN|nr:hypothetical protein [Actinomadura barringtoniae]MBO2449082.1 hypothetical protein [Actinomadura barringtoniae]
MNGPRDWQIDVYGDGDSYIAVDHESGDTVGAFVNEGGGWWRVRMPSGTVRGMWVRPGTDEPWREIVHRMIGA